MFKKEVRNLKLKMLNEDFKFEIKKDRIKKNSKLLNILMKVTKEDDIIIGSLALDLFGLLDRSINDLDISINDGDRYPYYRTGSYDDDLGYCNRLGYKVVKYVRNYFFFTIANDIDIDFYKNDNKRFIEFKYKGRMFKVSEPLNVIISKSEVDNTKNFRDLRFIFNKLGI